MVPFFSCKPLFLPLVTLLLSATKWLLDEECRDGVQWGGWLGEDVGLRDGDLSSPLEGEEGRSLKRWTFSGRAVMEV